VIAAVLHARGGRLAAALVLLAAVRTAGARGDEPEVRDYDQDEEERSGFWERALEPQRDRYNDLVERATALLRERDKESRELGGTILRDAIRLAPSLPAAHMLLGRYEAERGNFAACAKSIERALAADPDHRPPPLERPVEWAADYELGLCRARAGDYEAAIERLRRILERGHAGHEIRLVHQRMGECYMALGRIGEAKEAFQQGLKVAHDPDLVVALAVAHDRDEESAEARDLLARAREPNALLSAQRVWIPEEDGDYYIGLAFQHQGDHSRALYHFRRYLAAAGKSPWASRARNHYQEAQPRAVAGSDLVLKGSAGLDTAKAEAAIAKLDPELQACVKKSPGLLLRIAVTKLVPAGKRNSPSAAARPGVRVLVIEQHDLSADALAGIISCTESAAARAALPRPTGGPGTFALVEFTVIKR
jgi:tetratricopeptide (TPR) repeat protein